MAKRPVVRARSTPLTFIARSRQVGSEQKAIYHNVLGAGRKGVIREFFDLHPDEQRDIATTIDGVIQQRLDTM